MKKFSAVLTENIHIDLFKQLIRFDKQEDLCFATYIPSKGSNRFTGILSEIILPKSYEREVHGNAEFHSEYLLRAAKIAKDRNEGLVFLHSHPSLGWQGMSIPDEIAEQRISPTAFANTELPLLGLTLGTDGSWSARFWTKVENKKRTYNRNWCETVRVIGDKLSITYNNHILKPNINSEKQKRTISSWGQKTQKDLSRLKVGIVGLGSVGSIVAEILARTGISSFVLIDFDTIEEKNLDRTLGVFNSEIGLAKATAVADSIKKSASTKNPFIEAIEYSVCEKEGYLAALNCDVIFSCVDRPWARQTLNFISYGHLIPIIDSGIHVRTNKNNTKLLGAAWRAHVIGNKHTCLECLGQYTSEQAKLESNGLFDNPTYIEGLQDKSILGNSENVFAFSSHTASMAVLQFLSLFVSPGGISNIGQQIYQMALGKLERDDKICHENCYFQSILGKGDSINIVPYGKHKVAEKAREEREQNNMVKNKRNKNFFSVINKLLSTLFRSKR